MADQVADANFFMVQSKVAGDSLHRLPANEVVAFIQNDAALRQVGKLMVVDALLKNDDRLVGMRVNWGNFFFDSVAGTVNTIDNDASFSINNLTSHLGLLEKIIARPTDLFDSFKHYFRGKFATVPGAVEAFDDQVVRTALLAGIDAGIDDLVALLPSSEVATGLRLAKRRGGSTTTDDVDVAKGVSEYTRYRRSGGTEDEAKARLTKYLKYRKARNTLPTGLKWITAAFRGFSK